MPASADVAQMFIPAQPGWMATHYAIGTLALIGTVVLLMFLTSGELEQASTAALIALTVAGLICVITAWTEASRLARHSTTWSGVWLVLLATAVVAGLCWLYGSEHRRGDPAWWMWMSAAGILGLAFGTTLLEETITRAAAAIPLSVSGLLLLLVIGVGWAYFSSSPRPHQRRRW